MHLNPSDSCLARLAQDRAGQGGGFILADADAAVAGSWLTQVRRSQVSIVPFIGPAKPVLHTALSSEGRAELARVIDWISHVRTWGASYVRAWVDAWQEHGRMHEYGLLYRPYNWYHHAPPPSPPVTTWNDVVAQALSKAGGDHAQALEQLPDYYRADKRIYWSLMLAPLRYAEAFRVWCELARAGEFARPVVLSQPRELASPRGAQLELFPAADGGRTS